MKSPKSFAQITTVCALVLTQICTAQTPEELLEAQAGGIKLLNIKIEEGVLPNTTEKWLKLICTFSTEKEWTDVVSLNYEAIVGEPGGANKRLLTGGVSYINIPKGTSQAIMYLTPNTLKRFGTPDAVSVFAYRGDLPIGETSSSGAQQFTLEEKGEMLRFDGAIQNVRFTPWLLFDFGKTPDLAAM
jgi:hypothetical protein